MSDFGSCDFGAITPELMIKSLISGINERPTCGLRVVDVDTSGVTMYSTVPCATAMDLWSLFLRSLTIADDGMVAIRSTTTTANNGSGLSTCGNCADGWSIYEAMGSLFCQDASGTVYMNIVNIT